MTSDDSGRSQEDLLFVFWAVYHRVPLQVEEWTLFFRKIYEDIVGDPQVYRRGFLKAWRVRLSYFSFRSEFRRILLQKREDNRVEFALRYISSEKLQRLAPENIPSELALIEQDFVDRYYTEYLVTGGDLFLRRHFEQLRSAWIREAGSKVLPVFVLAATVVISIYAISAMRRVPAEAEASPLSWLESLKSLFFKN